MVKSGCSRSGATERLQVRYKAARHQGLPAATPSHPLAKCAEQQNGARVQGVHQLSPLLRVRHLPGARGRSRRHHLEGDHSRPQASVPVPRAASCVGSREGASRVRGRICCAVGLNGGRPAPAQAFQGRHGKAYLFHSVVNYQTGPREQRHLITGLHTVADISCINCNTVLGWKYVSAGARVGRGAGMRWHSQRSPPLLARQEQAFEESQKYKEGKFILEKAKIIKVERAVAYRSCQRLGWGPACTLFLPLLLACTPRSAHGMLLCRRMASGEAAGAHRAPRRPTRHRPGGIDGSRGGRGPRAAVMQPGRAPHS